MMSKPNSRRVKGVTVEYRPERGFLGTDTVGTAGNPEKS
jgi:hypothetical protein